MYQKKVTKKRFFDIVLQPELQYQNIYKEPVKRLACFKAITDQYDKEQTTAGYIDQNGVYMPPQVKAQDDSYFYGDAQAYEKHLDSTLKSLNQGIVPSTSSISKTYKEFQ